MYATTGASFVDGFIVVVGLTVPGLATATGRLDIWGSATAFVVVNGLTVPGLYVSKGRLGV